MAVKRYDGTDWQTVAGKGEQGTSSSITTWVKTAAGGETSLTGSSDSSTTLAYTPGQEQFFINGVLQVRGSDYTATNGTSITGIAALLAGDVATVTTVNAFSVTGAVPLSTVTANGDLIVGTSSGAVGRLGIGGTGTLLTVAGGVPTWAAPSAVGASWTLLNAGGTTLAGAQTVTVSGISGMNKLFIRLLNSSGGSASEISIRLNTDTGNNYVGIQAQVIAPVSGTDMNANNVTANAASLDRIQVGLQGVDTSRRVHGGVTIDGCNTANLKPYVVIGGGNLGNGEQRNYSGMGHYAGTSVITSVSAFSSIGNFDDGTMFVYGSAV